jgi:hypothetical protein
LTKEHSGNQKTKKQKGADKIGELIILLNNMRKPPQEVAKQQDAKGAKDNQDEVIFFHEWFLKLPRRFWLSR